MAKLWTLISALGFAGVSLIAAAQQHHLQLQRATTS